MGAAVVSVNRGLLKLRNFIQVMRAVITLYYSQACRRLTMCRAVNDDEARQPIPIYQKPAS